MVDSHHGSMERVANLIVPDSKLVYNFNLVPVMHGQWESSGSHNGSMEKNSGAMKRDKLADYEVFSHRKLVSNLNLIPIMRSQLESGDLHSGVTSYSHNWHDSGTQQPDEHWFQDWSELIPFMHPRLCMMGTPNRSSGTRNPSTSRTGEDDDDGQGDQSLVRREVHGAANSKGRGIALANETLRTAENPNLPTHRRFADMERPPGEIFGDGDEGDSRIVGTRSGVKVKTLTASFEDATVTQKRRGASPIETDNLAEVE